MDYESIKELAKEEGCSIKDLLALSQVNDPFYIAPADRKKAEWVTMIWHKEQSGSIHPRGFHYRIVDKNYKMPDGTTYLNTEKCWNFLIQGFKYARLLGLISYDKILDHKNVTEEQTGNFSAHEGVTYINNYDGANNNLSEDEDSDIFIEEMITEIKERFEVQYNETLFQPFYIEIWAEKSGIIPGAVASRFNATMRPAGGGEFSLDMCHKALTKAQELNKPLIIFLLSDFDPKGNDMPKSISRKIEFMAKERGITAYMKQICLTKDQCEKYNLPSIPAKNPDGDTQGAKAYRTHTNNFYNAMGRQTTEINSFMARDEEAYDKELRKVIEPYYDYDMLDKVHDFVEEIYDEIEECIESVINPNKEKIINLALKLTKSKEELEEFIEMKKQELGIGEMESEFETLTTIDENYIISNLLVEFPEAETETPTDALLDTTRDYLEQIEV